MDHNHLWVQQLFRDSYPFDSRQDLSQRKDGEITACIYSIVFLCYDINVIEGKYIFEIKRI